MNWRATIGWYEILGGAGGLLFVGYGALRHALLPGHSFEAAAGPFLVLALAGWRLTRGGHGDRWLSVLMQLLQVVFFDLGGVAWQFVGGLHASVAIINDKLDFWAGFDLTLTTGWRAMGQPVVLGINLVPIVVLVILARLPRTVLQQSTTAPSSPAA